ncbi:MAG TPA: hypothetical protein DCO78_14940, partial [Chitinophagaceae bacterium]|nr:hypothetical protein [Chitinophagaceae bacterium]
MPLLLFLWMMEQIPAPSDADAAARMERVPMSSAERKVLIRRFLPGIIAAVAIYLFATIFRDIRDNFSADMWKEMG